MASIRSRFIVKTATFLPAQKAWTVGRIFGQSELAMVAPPTAKLVPARRRRRSVAHRAHSFRRKPHNPRSALAHRMTGRSPGGYPVGGALSPKGRWERPRGGFRPEKLCFARRRISIKDACELSAPQPLSPMRMDRFLDSGSFPLFMRVSR